MGSEYLMRTNFCEWNYSRGSNTRGKNAESRADFIHKLGIAQKECDETIYWLEF